jgi:putative PIN family toxin of toxin-antitoxin system
LEGEFDLICSGRLLGELGRAFAYPKLSKNIQHAEAAAFLDLLSRSAVLVDDPELLPSVTSPDPDDNYLIALAETNRAVLVSGDQDLLSLSTLIPVFSPRAFLTQL